MTPSPRAGIRFDLESALVLFALAALCLLGWYNQVPIFEPIQKSRLTYLTVLALPFLLLGTLLVRRRLQYGIQLCVDLFPVLAVLAVYESLKHMHANRITEWLGITPKDDLMIVIDEGLFGKVLPLWFDGWNDATFILIMWYFYIYAYYLGPAIMVGYAYFFEKDTRLFRRVKRALVFGLLGGYVLYLLVPVAGPLYHLGEQFEHSILTQPIVERRTFDALRYNWDCFPSLHTAIPWLLVLVGWRHFRPLPRAIGVFMACGITASTIMLRFHYGIDVLAGLLWAFLIYKVIVAMEAATDATLDAEPDRQNDRKPAQAKKPLPVGAVCSVE